MHEPGDRRPASVEALVSRATRPRSLGTATLMAVAVALLVAVLWAFLRGILEMGPSLLALAAAGGWAIGALIRGASGPLLLAVGVSAVAWLLGLVGTWLVSMAVLQGSTRSIAERIEATPFLDWMRPQFGLLELAGLLLLVVAAAYGARPR